MILGPLGYGPSTLPLRHSASRVFEKFFLLLRLVRAPRCLCEQSPKVAMIGTQDTFKVSDGNLLLPWNRVGNNLNDNQKLSKNW